MCLLMNFKSLTGLDESLHLKILEMENTNHCSVVIVQQLTFPCYVTDRSLHHESSGIALNNVLINLINNQVGTSFFFLLQN